MRFHEAIGEIVCRAAQDTRLQAALVKEARAVETALEAARHFVAIWTGPESSYFNQNAAQADLRFALQQVETMRVESEKVRTR